MNGGRFLTTIAMILIFLITGSATLGYASDSNIKTGDPKSSSASFSNISLHKKPANVTTQESNSFKSNSSTYYIMGTKAGRTDGLFGVRDAGAACANLNGTSLNQCITGYNAGFNEICKTTRFGCS